MRTDLQRFGGGGETTLHPAALGALIAGVLLVLLLRRRYVVIPFLSFALFLPLQQQIVLAGAHFTAGRILILVGWSRLLWDWRLGSVAVRPVRLSAIDRALLWWVGASVLTFVLLWMQWDAVINRAGFLCDVLGAYFLLRALIREPQDLHIAGITLLSIACVVATLMMVEQSTNGRNLVGMAGIGPFPQDEVREGHIRSTACFAISILAGMFGATMLPLFFGLWGRVRKRRVMLVTGVVTGTIITLTSYSSGPLLAYAAAVVALSFWPFRNSIRAVRWTCVVVMIGLQVTMENPIWHGITRLAVIDGSSAYHRYLLIDQFLRHVGDWWLLGTRSSGTWGWMMWDTSNQYVNIGVTGGLATLVLFLNLLGTCWRELARSRVVCKKDLNTQWLLWGLTCTLFSQAIAFLSVTYFDQTVIVFYALLAMISMAVDVYGRKTRIAQHGADQRLIGVPSGESNELESSWVATANVLQES